MSATHGETISRVYEFQVEPTQIQALDANSFLLVDNSPQGRRVVAGTCDPLVTTLDRVSEVPIEEYAGPPAAGRSGRNRAVSAGDEPGLNDLNPIDTLIRQYRDR